MELPSVQNINHGAMVFQRSRGYFASEVQKKKKGMHWHCELELLANPWEEIEGAGFRARGLVMLVVAKDILSRAANLN